ncbi:MAG: DUF5319 family protein [Actinomycetota bacterium]
MDDERDDERDERDERDDEGDADVGDVGERGARLDPEEERDVRADLRDLAAMREVFAPQGVKGVVIACPDCGEGHYYEWELLRENLEHLLATGESRTHEPAFDVHEEDYIEWDYGRGYVDALGDSGLGADRRVPVVGCPWCAVPVADDAVYCARCGRSLAPLRVYRELLARGMAERDVRELLLRAGVEPFR